jgi:hypothetical protein
VWLALEHADRTGGNFLNGGYANGDGIQAVYHNEMLFNQSILMYHDPFRTYLSPL